MIEVRNRWTGALVGTHTYHHNALTDPPVLVSQVWRRGARPFSDSVRVREYEIYQCVLPTGVGFKPMKYIVVDDSNELRGDPQFLPLHG